MNFFLNISFPNVDEGSISNTKTPEKGRLISGKYRLFFDDLIQDISHSETSYINLDNTKFTNILTCLRIGDLNEIGTKQLMNQMIEHKPLPYKMFQNIIEDNLRIHPKNMKDI